MSAPAQRSVVVLGAGGFAREIVDLIGDMGPDSGLTVLGFLDRDSSRKGESLNGTPIMGAISDVQLPESVCGVAGSGDVIPRTRQAEELAAAGIEPVTLVHPLAVISPSATIGAGSVVCAHTVVTANSTLGRHVVVNYGATVGHDITVGDYCVIGPGARVSGWVTLGTGCYLGAGAVILPRVTVGEGAVIGAGAVVTKDVEPGVTVMGVPARAVEGGRG